MKQTSRILALLLALTASVALAACGGDDGSDAPTKSEFIAEADAICAQGDEEIQKAGEEQFGDEAPNREDLVAFAEDTVIPNIEQQATDLRELTPPEGDEKTIESLLDSLDDGVSELADDPAAAVESQQNPLVDANEQAREYSLTSCGNDG